MSYIYIASPYSHDDPEVRQARFKQVCRYAGLCLTRGEDVFSPIAHTHPIAMYWMLPKGWEFWKRIDTVMIRMASKLRVYKMAGWDTSVGVHAEIELAKSLNIPVEYVEVEKEA